MEDVQLEALGRRRWWALGALAVSVLVVGLDLFVLSLALPTLAVHLHASTGDLQWFVDAYSLVLAAALLPAGLLGDRIGRKKLLICALGVFGIASLACAYSTSTGELIAARAVLGLAAAVILPLALAVLPVMFTAEERPKAIGIVGGATFIGYPLGPILGGWLLDHYWWGSVFLINVPIVVLALATVMFLMPESRGSGRFRIDFAGVLISSAGLVALTYGVIRAGQDGWSDTLAVATMVAGAAALALFVAWERLVGRRGRQPLVDLSLFSSGGFTWGTTLSTMISFALFGLTFAMPQFFLDVKGLDSLASGIRMLPLIGGLAVGLGVGQRLQSPQGARWRDQASAGRRAADRGGRFRDHGCRAGRRHGHLSCQRHRLHLSVVRGDRVRPRAGDADDAERRAERAVSRAQRVGLRADDSGSPGRGHDRRRGARHRAELGLPRPPRRGGLAAGDRGRGQEQRRDRRCGRGQARLGTAARCRSRRVRRRRRRHALGLRCDRDCGRRARALSSSRATRPDRRRRQPPRQAENALPGDTPAQVIG